MEVFSYESCVFSVLLGAGVRYFRWTIGMMWKNDILSYLWYLVFINFICVLHHTYGLHVNTIYWSWVIVSNLWCPRQNKISSIHMYEINYFSLDLGVFLYPFDVNHIWSDLIVKNVDYISSKSYFRIDDLRIKRYDPICCNLYSCIANICNKTRVTCHAVCNFVLFRWNGGRPIAISFVE